MTALGIGRFSPEPPNTEKGPKGRRRSNRLAAREAGERT